MSDIYVKLKTSHPLSNTQLRGFSDLLCCGFLSAKTPPLQGHKGLTRCLSVKLCFYRFHSIVELSWCFCFSPPSMLVSGFSFPSLTAEKSAQVFREQKLVISSFLSFLYKRYIFPQLVGNTNSKFLNYGALQYYSTGTRREILNDRAIFREHLA